MAETENPAGEIPEISEPCVEVPVTSYEVFVPEENISITVPVSQTIPITDSFSLDMKVMTKNTGLKTRMKAQPTNKERCKAYRERKKIEKELMMKEFEEETKRNEELKLVLKQKEEELDAFLQLLITKDVLVELGI